MGPKIIKRTKIYESEWVNLYTDKVKFPAGRVVDKHHHLQYHHESVGAIVENDKGKILLVRAYRYITGHHGWEIPAGGIDKGENPEEGAIREIVEESGYIATDTKHLYTYDPSNGITDQVFHIISCRTEENTGSYDKNEVQDYRWFAPNEIHQMIAKQEIRDGLSLTGLLIFFNKTPHAH